jgi:hypothetical protein
MPVTVRHASQALHHVVHYGKCKVVHIVNEQKEDSPIDGGYFTTRPCNSSGTPKLLRLQQRPARPLRRAADAADGAAEAGVVAMIGSGWEGYEDGPNQRGRGHSGARCARHAPAVGGVAGLGPDLDSFSVQF